MLTSMDGSMDMHLWVMIVRRWRDSGSGRLVIGRMLYTAFHTTSGGAIAILRCFANPCSALYVVDIKRFRQVRLSLRPTKSR
jgi:hypothetical protein